ncbi:MAG: VWA domain-containing protein [Deltaproteobacteria bacterium]|nr:VWA domain-containing protein [Deltaproteobacteria bacterium]
MILTQLVLSTLLTGTPEPTRPVSLTLGLANPVLLADSQNTTYLKIGLDGGQPPSRPSPVNLAIVLDRSGSMAGDKIMRAKEAAKLLVERLNADDILSIIAYDDAVSVIVPATKLTDKTSVLRQIDALNPNGSTALFAGVSMGISEVKKFFEQGRVNRVILMSDGQANVGPSSPNELGQLGTYAARRGISVSTIGLGLGYNEDLMTALARRADGNHDFAERSEDLARIFDVELKDVLSVVAQEVAVRVELPQGVTPVRSLNRDAEIRGRSVYLSMNQLYARQEKFLLLEVKVDPAAAGKTQELARVNVSYADVAAKGATARLSASASVMFSLVPAEVERATNREVMVAAVEALATKRNELALALRDEGKVKEAERVLLENSATLREAAVRFGSQKLDSYGTANEVDARNLAPEGWNQRRKLMRKQQYMNETQQAH